MRRRAASGSRAWSLSVIAELVRVIQSTDPVGDPVGDAGRQALGVDVAVGRHLLDVRHPLQLLPEHRPAAVGPGQQHPTAGDAVPQRLGQGLRAERVGDQVGPEVVAGQRLGGGRADGRQLQRAQGAQVPPAGDQAGQEVADPVARGEDQPVELREPREGPVQGRGVVQRAGSRRSAPPGPRRPGPPARRPSRRPRPRGGSGRSSARTGAAPRTRPARAAGRRPRRRSTARGGPGRPRRPARAGRAGSRPPPSGRPGSPRGSTPPGSPRACRRGSGPRRGGRAGGTPCRRPGSRGTAPAPASRSGWPTRRGRRGR
jgi:hypothetical protein